MVWSQIIFYQWFIKQWQNYRCLKNFAFSKSIPIISGFNVLSYGKIQHFPTIIKVQVYKPGMIASFLRLSQILFSISLHIIFVEISTWFIDNPAWYTLSKFSILCFPGLKAWAWSLSAILNLNVHLCCTFTILYIPVLLKMSSWPHHFDLERKDAIMSPIFIQDITLIRRSSLMTCSSTIAINIQNTIHNIRTLWGRT